MATVRTAYEWFLESARAYPELTALRVDAADCSYRQLHLASARVASQVLAEHADRPRRVGVVATRALGTYVAYLAGLRLGAAVVPLNSEFPLARNSVVAAAAGLDVLLSPAETAGYAAELGEAVGMRPIVLAGSEELTWTGSESDLGEPHLADVDDIAYILFTSGSTGAPKGVPIKHSCLSSYLSHVIPHYCAGPGMRVTQMADLTFDLSAYPLFVAWGSGGAVIVPSREDLLEPVRHVVGDRITHWLSVSSVVSLAQQLQNLPPGSMPDLRWSLFLGEPLTVDQARIWYEAAPNSTLENLYGPTEVTISCTAYRLSSEPSEWPEVNGTVSIGGPYPEVECLVVDEAGHRADEGELLLRGPQRFDGYLDRTLNAGRFAYWDGERARIYDGAQELTAAHWYRTGDRVRIVGGELFHLGRIDNQLKICGYRIEPGEIEATLRRHPAVDEAVVVPRAVDGDVELAAAYVGRPAAANELAEYLRNHLPGHMVPSCIARLPEFPRNVNGKVDRPRLTSEAVNWTG
jgi:amino acid adenylation domain-containing protein